MNNYIVLDKRKNFSRISSIIKNLNLKNTLKNRRTSIWENDDLEISIDRTIIRVLIFKSKDISYYNKFFRGKYYEKRDI